MDSLHGGAPDRSGVALIMIDVINDLEFEGGDALAKHALPMAARLAALGSNARAAGIPVIYANDNFGRWRTDFASLVRRCRADPVRGRPIVELLTPGANDYFVLKPKHSAFFATPLDVLLRQLGVHTVILTGLTADMCVQLTAADAFMRDLRLVIPEDCVASLDAETNRLAIRYMQRVMDADVRPSRDLDLRALCAEDDEPHGKVRVAAPDRDRA